MIYYVTFYSYKGGVGRTLSLINTAYSLVTRGKKVLIWDLDLEAPSLLQFPQFSGVRKHVAGGTIDVLVAPEMNVAKQVAKLIVPADRGIWLLPAGADDLKYPERYAGLPLDRLFGPNAAEASRRFEQMRQGIENLPEKTRPDVVLIDSRTGLTDLGAICTVQLPHTVVLVYTMSHQGAFGAQRMIGNILSASKRLRLPEQQVKILLVAGFVPTDQDTALVEERRGQLREMGLSPDFEIPFRSALLLREEVDATSVEFGRLADRLLELAPAKEEPVRFSLERFPDSRQGRGRSFEDKVATVLRLMDLEVTQNTLIAGRQTDIVAHRKGGFEEVDLVVECKDHERLTGVDDLDSLHARLAALRKEKPWAKGLLVSTKGFTAEARAHAKDLPMLLNTYDELLDRLINLGPYNGTLIHDVAGQPIERLYVEQDVYPEEKPEPVALFEYVDRWLADPESTFLTILGDYGTGKTWFTRMLAYRQAQSVRDDGGNQGQPVRIDLRTVAKAIDLENILFSHFQTSTGRATNPKAFLHLLEEGRFLLIFDGFDEMATQGDWSVTLENFRQLARAAAGRAKVLLTCRTHYFRDQSYVQELIAGRRPDLSERGTELYREISGRRGYRLAYLQGFNDDQMHQYIDRACGDRAAEVHQILEREPRLKEIANRPILLEIIVKSAPKLAQLGNDITIANLYEAYTEDWFTREDWRLRITRERRRELVEALAAHLWREPDARMHHTALRQVIEPLLNDRAFTVRDLEDADREIRTATFLTRDAQGNYGFSHRSFLEFFLASWIRRRLVAGDYTAALRHPLLTLAVIQFLEEFTSREQREAAVRSVLETAYVAEASENALLLYGPLKVDGLRAAHLEGARLAKFDLRRVDLNGANLTRADLGDASLVLAELKGAILREANLDCANLVGADATGADFTGANLQGADLGAAHLESADFSSADLSFSNLVDAQTAGAVWHESKRFGDAGPERPPHAGVAVGALSAFSPSAIAAHPALPLIAVVTAEGVVIVDSVTGRLRRHFSHRSATSVAWACDGRRLASGSDDHTIRVWDVEDGRLLRTLERHHKGVLSVAWDEKGNRLASGSADKMVRVWDVREGKLLCTLEGHGGRVFSVAWDGTGARLASASNDQTVRIWDVASGRVLCVLEGHVGWVRAVAWDGGGNRVATGSDDETVRVWDSVEGRLLRTLEGHGGAVWSVAWDRQRDCLASGSTDKAVRLWDPTEGQLLRTLEAHGAHVWSVAWDRAGRLISASEDQTVRVWDVMQGQPLRTLEGHRHRVSSVAWGSQGRLASASDQTVEVWDTAQGQLLRTFECDSPVNSVAWDGDSRRLALASFYPFVQVWDVVQSQLLRMPEGHHGPVLSVAWDPEGRRLASGSHDNTVRVWDAARGGLLRTLEGHRSSVRSVAWHREGRRLASGSADETVRVWDVALGQLLRTLEGHGGRVNSVAWDEEGRRLASGSDDHAVRVWDPAQGQLLRTLEGHGGPVRSVAWDRGGRRLASASSDHTVRVWDAEQERPLRTLEGHRGGVRSVAWETEGKLLASASEDSTIKIWDAETGECLWTIHHLPDDGRLAMRADGKFRGNGAGKRHFMFADGWALYPARVFTELDLDA